jgi:hypothetical protein
LFPYGSVSVRETEGEAKAVAGRRNDIDPSGPRARVVPATLTWEDDSEVGARGDGEKRWDKKG